MRVLRPTDYRRMPWRNGGGSTTEITIAPDPAGDRFIHRVSIADVSMDGPFSRFEGYDRHIMVLEGTGMTLDCGSHGSIALRPLEPRTFSGDWEVTGTLDGGPVRDFNVIVDRARATAGLAVLSVSGSLTLPVRPGETCILHVLSGATDRAAAGDTIVAEEPFTLVATAERTSEASERHTCSARFALARVLRR